MEIRIAFNEIDPPTGRVVRCDRADSDLVGAAEFSGWMDLLQLVYELIATPAEDVARP
jgi:hypothetical protein